MRRTLPFVALWFCGGALAVAVASVGVAVVDDQLTESRPAPLSADEVHERLAAGTTSTTDGATTTASTSPPPTTATTASPPTTGGTDGGTDGDTDGGQGTPTTTAPPEGAVTRTYELVGGTTTIRFSPTEIKVLTASPKPGFTAEVEPEAPGFKVEFESETHKSRIDAWWSNGPQTRIREDADD